MRRFTFLSPELFYGLIFFWIYVLLNWSFSAKFFITLAVCTIFFAFRKASIP